MSWPVRTRLCAAAWGHGFAHWPWRACLAYWTFRATAAPADDWRSRPVCVVATLNYQVWRDQMRLR
ncbi:MAG: hypothetical protein KJP13_02180, partial [Altererythrobacter sp.]|nr:hypothetical protein [Altererythrobacter sp.]